MIPNPAQLHCQRSALPYLDSATILRRLAVIDPIGQFAGKENASPAAPLQTLPRPAADCLEGANSLVARVLATMMTRCIAPQQLLVKVQYAWRR